MVFGSVAVALLILVLLIVGLPLVLLLILNSVGNSMSARRRTAQAPQLDKESIRLLTDAAKRNPNPPAPMRMPSPPPPAPLRQGELPPPQGSAVDPIPQSSDQTDNLVIAGAYIGVVFLLLAFAVATAAFNPAFN